MEPRRAQVAELAVEHVPHSPSDFSLTRISDGKSLPVVTLRSPYEFPVKGRPDSNLMRELR